MHPGLETSKYEIKKPDVRDEGLPIHGEDVAVLHPDPGHGHVVQVGDGALHVGHAAKLTSEQFLPLDKRHLLPLSHGLHGLHVLPVVHGGDRDQA